MPQRVDVIDLYGRITELNEDAVVVINRKFSEVESHLSRLQQYMNETGFDSLERLQALNPDMISHGPEKDLPTV